MDDREELAGYVEVWWQAVNDFLELLESVPEAQWSAPTDLPGWDVRAVASHTAHLEGILAGGPEETAEQVYALWEAAVGRARARLRELVADGGLDQPGHLQLEDARPTVRRHLHDLIEEYGRHTGHMDLLREAIDGRVGEDPPRDWPMRPADPVTPPAG